MQRNGDVKLPVSDANSSDVYTLGSSRPSTLPTPLGDASILPATSSVAHLLLKVEGARSTCLARGYRLKINSGGVSEKANQRIDVGSTSEGQLHQFPGDHFNASTAAKLDQASYQIDPVRLHRQCEAPQAATRTSSSVVTPEHDAGAIFTVTAAGRTLESFAYRVRRQRHSGECPNPHQ